MVNLINFYISLFLVMYTVFFLCSFLYKDVNDRRSQRIGAFFGCAMGVCFDYFLHEWVFV